MNEGIRNVAAFLAIVYLVFLMYDTHARVRNLEKIVGSMTKSPVIVFDEMVIEP